MTEQRRLNMRFVLTALIPLLAVAVGYGALRATVDTHSTKIEALEHKLDERSLSLEATGAGRVILERLNEINARLDKIDQRLERIEHSGR